MKLSLIILAAGLALQSGAVRAAGGAPVSMEPGPSIEIPSSKGTFDFLRVDEKRHRLLGAHETDGTADKQLVYCAGLNKISIVDTSGSNVATVGEQATAATARNVAVDPQTHAVWTTYTNGKSSFARAWLPKR